ncbi:MAG: hypothetical protein ACR2MQ_04135 [Gemmatimonadaceae bacterium]
MSLCQYCGLREAGSREHLPGVAALNDAPVVIRYLVSEAGEMRHVERREADGFVVRTICGKCNQRTGGNYGTAFKGFALQFRSIGAFDDSAGRTWVSLRHIQPLRVLKQLAAMFLASQVEPVLDKWSPIREFVLQRDKKLPSGSLRFFLYRNVSQLGRVSSMSGIGFLFQHPRWDTLIASEISWPPLGIVFSLDAHPHLAGMKEITEWGQYSFKARDSFGFSVPQYRVETNWPVAYGTPREVDAWTTAKGVVVAATNSLNGSAPGQIAALIRQVRDPSA